MKMFWISGASVQMVMTVFPLALTVLCLFGLHVKRLYVSCG